MDNQEKLTFLEGALAQSRTVTGATGIELRLAAVKYAAAETPFEQIEASVMLDKAALRFAKRMLPDD